MFAKYPRKEKYYKCIARLRSDFQIFHTGGKQSQCVPDHNTQIFHNKLSCRPLSDISCEAISIYKTTILSTHFPQNYKRFFLLSDRCQYVSWGLFTKSSFLPNLYLLWRGDGNVSILGNKNRRLKISPPRRPFSKY